MAEGDTPAVETPKPAGSVPDAGSSPQPVPPPVADAPPAEPDYKDRRIARLTAKLREAEEEARQLKAAQGNDQSPPPPPAVGRVFTEAEVEAEVAKRTSVRSAVSEFQRICDECVIAGRRVFGDWDQHVASMKGKLVGDGGDATTNAAYNAMIQAAIETGDGPGIIYELAQNPDEASRVMSLSPTKMGIELARKATALGEGKSTQAPRPLRPIVPRGGTHVEIDPTDPERGATLGKDEWFKRRQAQVDAREKRTA